MLPFRGLTLLSVTFVHCAQTAEDIVTISFAYDSPMSLQIALKFVLHRSTLTPQILPQTDPPPVGVSIGDIAWSSAAEWLETAQ